MKQFKSIALTATMACLAACSSVEKQPELIESDGSTFQSKTSAQCSVIAAVGDIMMGGKSAPYFNRRGYDSAFQPTREWLLAADVTIGNLETALTDTEEKFVEKQFKFKNPPVPVAKALRNAGFNIVSLANNHSMDYGTSGLADTLKILDQFEIQYHGAGMDINQARQSKIVIADNGQKIGFLAYSNTFPKEFWADEANPGTAFGHLEHIVEDVEKLKLRSDFVVVSFHWGREKARKLRPYQPMLAKAAIDAGANLIIGHHPHVLQGVEEYQGGLILYSLGNFAFGSFSTSATTSALANVKLCDNGETRLEMVPINVNNFEVYFQPTPVHGEAAVAIFNELDQMSSLLGTKLNFNNDRITLTINSKERLSQNDSSKGH